MKISTLDWVFEKFNIPVTLYRNENSKGLLVVFPGGGYSSFGPALYYPTNLYLNKSYDVLSLDYDFKRFSYEGDRAVFLKALGLFIFQKINIDFNQQKIHLIAKSIGTNIIAESYDQIDANLKERIQKVVLLTPVWNQSIVMEKLLPLGSKSFHVIGTADKLYDKDFEKVLLDKNIGFLTISNADHGLDIEGDVEQSLIELKKLVSAIQSFVSL